MSPRREGAVRLSAGFCLLSAWFAWANGWRMLLTVLGAASVHELGHCLALEAQGARVTGLRVGACGAVLETGICTSNSAASYSFCLNSSIAFSPFSAIS